MFEGFELIFFLFYSFLVGLVASDGAWKPNHEYKYDVETRTLTALPDLKQQWVGMVTRARLHIRPQADNVLIGKLMKPEFAEVHQELNNGWDMDLSGQKLAYHQMPMSQKPFEVRLKNGAIRSLAVDRTMTNEQINMLKAIISPLQADTKAQNEIRCKHNQMPEEHGNNGVYKTMEPTVTGECETLYDISPLPEYLTQTHRDWVPMPQLKGNGEFIDIVKTKNFSNCDQRMGYHFGITGHSE